MTGFGDSKLKFPLILAISIFMSSFNFMLSRVEHGFFFIILGPGSSVSAGLPCHFVGFFMAAHLAKTSVASCN